VTEYPFYSRTSGEFDFSPPLSISDESDSLDNDYPIPETPIQLILTVNASQFTNLLSAALNGALLSWPDDYNQVIWPLLKAGKMPLIIDCKDVADCIETNEATQNAINTVVQNTGYIYPDSIDTETPLMDTRFPDADRDEEITTPPEMCDKDVLWAGILETVTRLDDNAKQFLDQAVAQSDKAERAAQMVSLIPIIGDLAADVITIFTETAPDLQNLFIAYSSQANIENAACEIFEMVCNECRYPTYDDYWNYYKNQGITGLDDIGSLTFLAITDLLMGTQNLLASVCWHTMIAYELFIMYLGSTFTGFRGTKWLGIWAKLGEDDASSDWEILCDGCGDTWCYEISVANGLLESLPTPSNIGQGVMAVWHATEGWGRGANTSTDNFIGLDWDFGFSLTFTTINVYYSVAPSNGNRINVPSTNDTQEAQNDGNVQTGTFTPFSGPIDTMSTLGNWLGAAPVDARLTKIIIEGDGTNPFGADNCT